MLEIQEQIKNPTTTANFRKGSTIKNHQLFPQVIIQTEAKDNGDEFSPVV